LGTGQWVSFVGIVISRFDVQGNVAASCDKCNWTSNMQHAQHMLSSSNMHSDARHADSLHLPLSTHEVGRGHGQDSVGPAMP